MNVPGSDLRTAGVSGRVVVVTGAAAGIGAAVCQALARAGAIVVGLDVAADDGERADLALGRVDRVDVTDEDAIRAALDRCRNACGGVDHLVNAAGIFPRADTEHTSAELWRRVLDVNLTGPFLLIRAAAPLIAARGGGAIVNIGSLHARVGPPELVAYAASKGGLRTLTRTHANEFAKHGIRVNVVDPGWVATEGEVALRAAQGHEADWLASQGSNLPLGRLQTPGDLAGLVTFLLSDAACQITGQVIAVDGGMGVRPV